MLQPIAFGTCIPRIPDIQQALGLGPADLAIALLGMPCGILVALPVASRIYRRLGGRATIAIGFITMALTISMAVWSLNQLMLYATLALVGAANTLLLLALNLEASIVEKQQGSLILNTCHGFGSVGLMLGSMLGSALAAMAIPYTWAVIMVAFATLSLSIATVIALSDQQSIDDTTEDNQNHRPTLPDWPLLQICFFAFGIALTEGAMADWSALYLRDHFSASPGAAGIGFTIFAAMVAVGRFKGDYMKLKWGATRTAKVCTGLAFCGIIIALTAPDINLAFTGFALLGFGVSVGYPLAVSATANLCSQQSTANVATLTFIALMGFLVGPPLIGFIAEYASVRHGLAALVPVLVVSMLFTNSLGKTTSKKVI